MDRLVDFKNEMGVTDFYEAIVIQVFFFCHAALVCH